MKRILKKGLISILIVLIVVNFISASTINVSYGIDLGDIFSGLIGVITWIPRALMMAALMGLNKLITAFAAFGLEGIENYGLGDIIGFTEDSYLTPFHIFFNKIALLDVNFLNFEGLTPGGTVETFRTAVAGWYYTMRLIACMVLAVILIYIGIRMAISTIASEKAMYKKMLVDWMTSLALLFLLHYIMLFTFACNDALINAIEGLCEEANLDAIMLKLQGEAFGIQIIEAVAAMILFGIIIGQTLSFLFAYVKRMLTIGFLIMIAPLITITYSIDKIGDGKAQALNTWLKEFVYNVLIQPFHCILFAAFASVAYKLIQDSEALLSVETLEDTSIAAMILAICCIQFIKTGEELVKKIFGFGQASSLTTMAAGAAMTMAAINKGTSAGQTIGSGAAKAKNFVSNHSDKISKATGNLTKKVGGLVGKVDKFERNADGSIKRDEKGNAVLSRAGNKKAEKEAAKLTGEKHSWESQDAYAERYQRNFESASKQMDMKQASKQQKKVDKLVAKQTKAINKAREYDKVHGEGSYAKHQQEKKERKEKRSEKVRKITGAVGNASKSVGGFLSEHKQDIAKMQAGFVMATIGMGAGGMSGALIGAKFGSGVAQGYMANTNKTLQEAFQGLATASKNLDDDPNVDMEAKAYALYATAQNGGFDKVEEKLDKILDKIAGLTSAQKQSFKNNLSMQMLKDPKQIDETYLKNMATSFGVENPEETVSGMKQYAKLATDARLAQSITDATSTRTIEQVAMAVSYVNNSTNIENNNTVNQNVQHEQNITEGISDAEARRQVEQTAEEDLGDARDAMPTPPPVRPSRPTPPPTRPSDTTTPDGDGK